MGFRGIFSPKNPENNLKTVNYSPLEEKNAKKSAVRQKANG